MLHCLVTKMEGSVNNRDFFTRNCSTNRCLSQSLKYHAVRKKQTVPRKQVECLRVFQVYSPLSILAQRIETYESRSGRLCSWKNPRECAISCTMLPCLQVIEPSEFPTEIVCLPPIRPTYDEHLKVNKREQRRYLLANWVFSPSISNKFARRICSLGSGGVSVTSVVSPLPSVWLSWGFVYFIPAATLMLVKRSTSV